MQLGEANQGQIADGKRLDLSPVYQGLGEAFLTKATMASARSSEPGSLQKKEEAYVNAVSYFAMVSQTPSGFAPSDARLFSRLAEAYEGKAQMDVQELATAVPNRREPLTREHDELRNKSEESMRRLGKSWLPEKSPQLIPISGS